MSLINIEKTVTLDVYDHDTTPSVVKTIQLDTGTRTIFAMIQNSRQDYDIGQNAAVKLTVLRPDKTKVQITGQTFVSYTGADGTMYGAKAELSDVALAVKGNLKAQFKITSGEQELRTEIFTINNGEALDAGDGDWAGDLDGHNLDEMAQDIEDTKAAVSEMETDVSELKEDLSEVTEEVLFADITPTINRTSEINGLMLSMSSPGVLKAYGTASSTRRYICLNGQDEIKTSNATFSKTLDAGKYHIEMGVTGYQTTLGWQYTYSTFASASLLVNNNNPTITIGFTDPVMIGVVFQGGTNYGTSDNPTYITFNAVKLTANDLKIRDEITTLKNNVYGFIPELNLFKLFASISDGTSKDVTFTWDEEKTECTINGTSTGTSDNPARNTFYNSNLPEWLKKGKTYLVTLESSDENIFIRANFYDSNTTLLLRKDIYDNEAVTIPEETTRFTLRLQVTDGATVSNATVKNICVRLEEHMPIKLHVCTYNIGRYNYGYTPSSERPIADLTIISGQMKEFFRTNRFDMFAVQEGQTALDGESVFSKIYRYLFPNRVIYSDTSKPYSPSFYTKFKILDSGEGILTSNRPYVWALIDIYGINVFIMSVHLSLTLSERETSYDEIKEIVANHNYFIVFGDFNAGNGVTDWDAQPEYDELLENGWHTANGGYWGQYNTYAPSNESDPPRRLDTIVTSSNISIDTYDAPYLRSTMPSDHRPLMCDITIY